MLWATAMSEEPGAGSKRGHAATGGPGWTEGDRGPEQPALLHEVFFPSELNFAWANVKIGQWDVGGGDVCCQRESACPAADMLAQ